MSGAINKERFLALMGQYQKMNELDRVKLAKKMVAYNPDAREYSLTNKCLLALQKGLVGRYGGFHSWIKLGKIVRKGEKGFLIAAPCISKEEAKKPEDERIVRFFRHTSIFHESQTDSLPLKK